MDSPVIIAPKIPDPLHSKKQKLCLVLDYHLLNKSINAVHNDKNVIFTTLYQTQQTICKIAEIILFIGSKIRIPSLWPNPEAKPKTGFATTSGLWHWNAASFGIWSLPGIFCYMMSQLLSGLNFCFTYLDNILVYRTSWEEHLLHLEIIFNHLKFAEF